MKKPLLILALMAFVSFHVHAVEDGENEDSPAENAAPVPPLAAAPVSENSVAPRDLAVVPAVTEEEPDHKDTPLEACLFSIYRGQPTPPPPSDPNEVIVTAYDFDTDFWARTDMNDDTGSKGFSFFLTSNSFFSSSASFRILDSGPDGKQWECSHSSRMRRLNTDESFNMKNDEEATDTNKTAADLNKGNQWGSGADNSGVEDVDRDAVYVVQTGSRFYRVSCSVQKKRAFLIFGAHRNENCTANPIAVATVGSKNIKVCKESDKDTPDFIENALKRRDKYLDKHAPKDKEALEAVSSGFNEMQKSCSSLISSDNDAKMALHRFGQNINEHLVEFNKKNPTTHLPMVNSFAK